MIRLLFLCFFVTLTARAEWRVVSDFEGGNAEVVALDAGQQRLRIRPKLHEGRGWPCWWYFKLEGLSPGQTFSLEIERQPLPYRPGMILNHSWCQPRHAWLSLDGSDWVPSSEGSLDEDKVMHYSIKAESSSLFLAWGPPFVPSDAERLLQTVAAELPEAARFELAKTRGGRSVPGIRIGAENAPHQVWVNARHHAWEAGGSQVGRGFLRWYVSPEAAALRAKTCLHFIPIMDVDNVAIGSGGKEALPQDHNRDWSAAPLYPEVAAAQARIRAIQEKHGLDVYIDLHNPGSGDPIFFFGPFAFDRMAGAQQRNYQRWIELATATMSAPVPLFPKYRFATYVTTEEERGRMSSGWVRANTSESTLSVTLETGWNSPKMSAEGYAQVGQNLGLTLKAYLEGK